MCSEAHWCKKQYGVICPLVCPGGKKQVCFCVSGSVSYCVSLWWTFSALPNSPLGLSLFVSKHSSVTFSLPCTGRRKVPETTAIKTSDLLVFSIVSVQGDCFLGRSPCHAALGRVCSSACWWLSVQYLIPAAMSPGKM